MYVAVLIGLAAFLIFSILAAITFGNADLSLKDVYSVIAYKLFHIKSLSAYAEGAVHDVVWLIRLPRVLLALAVGMALSVCGVVMQAIVQNPLADPYVLGISSGASFGATLAIMLGVGGFLGGNSVGVTAKEVTIAPINAVTPTDFFHSCSNHFWKCRFVTERCLQCHCI